MERTQTALAWQDRPGCDAVPCKGMLWHALLVDAGGVVSPILDVECGVVGRVEGGDVADKVLDVVKKLRFAIAKSKSRYHSHRQPLRWAPHSYC